MPDKPTTIKSSPENFLNIEAKAIAFATLWEEFEDHATLIKKMRRDAVAGVPMKKLRDLAFAVRQSRDEALNLVEDFPELFVKPKSVTFDGVKVGFLKKRGSVEIPDEEKTIKLIRETLPADQVELMLRVKTSVDRNQAATLTTYDQKRLGMSTVDDSEHPFCKITKGDIDSLIDALFTATISAED